MGAWCVIVVPGINRLGRNAIRDQVAENLLSSEALALEETSPDGDNEAIRSLTAAVGHRSVSKFDRLDLMEAYWADLVPNDSEAKPLSRMLGGFMLTRYWVLSPSVWGAVFSDSWFVALGCMLAGFGLTLWTVSALATAFEWLSQAVSWQVLPAPAWVKSLSDALHTGWGRYVNVGFQVFTIVLPLTGAVLIADIAKLCRAYLLDAGGAAVGIRSGIRKRVRDPFLRAMTAKYERIVFVAHSLGTMPVIDLLADWPVASELGAVRVITLGSPCGLFSHKASWVREQLEAALNQRLGHGWRDYRYDGDFWSTGLTAPRMRPREDSRFADRKLIAQGGVIAGLNGTTHLQYFREAEVLAAIVQ